MARHSLWVTGKRQGLGRIFQRSSNTGSIGHWSYCCQTSLAAWTTSPTPLPFFFVVKRKKIKSHTFTFTNKKTIPS